MSKSTNQRIKAAWRSFQDACSDPVSHLQFQPPFKAAQTAWDIPVELASAGFNVTMASTAHHWSIDCEIEAGGELICFSAVDKSLLTTLETLARVGNNAFVSILEDVAAKADLVEVA